MWASCPTRRETAGDFTIAPWKRSRSAGIGYACERGPLPSAAARLPPVSLRLGPAAALTCHRHVIHYRGARFARPKGKAFFLCAARDYILQLRGRRSDQGIAPYAGCRHRIKQRRGGACPSRIRRQEKRGRGKPLPYRGHPEAAGDLPSAPVAAERFAGAGRIVQSDGNNILCKLKTHKYAKLPLVYRIITIICLIFPREESNMYA